MSKSIKVTVDGIEYTSRSAAAKAMVAAGKSIKEAAITCGMKYQTVYAVTRGSEKVAGRVKKYRAIKLAKSGRLTAGAIAKKVGMPKTTCSDMLKRLGIKAGSKAVKMAEPMEATIQTMVEPAVVVDVPSA